nr:immunoglobulin light chain junction region [Macaca mulatta]MOW31852.1 immunoglobulin light chain junction region [Macaca mulatta]
DYYCYSTTNNGNHGLF